MKKTAFLFDLDGTLVDSLPDLVTTVNLLRRECELEPLPRAKIATYVGDGAPKLLERSLPTELLSDESMTLFYRLYGEHVCDETRLYPDILEFLENHSTCPMAVVTNKPMAFTEKLLKHLGVYDLFSVVLGLESCPTRKPDPGPVLEALRVLKADAASAVMIGDHHTDLKAGREAGVATCFCFWGIGEDGGIPYDYSAAQPADLLKLFPS